FNAQDAFDAPWAESAIAGGVFFPKVVPGLTQSQLVPIDATSATLELMPQAIEGWDKSAIADSLQLISKLVNQTPCYILQLAPDVDKLPSLIQIGLEL
ncbi:MAG: hypothetical protein AAF485_30560, partial [Chloroflexota bacterium]